MATRMQQRRGTAAQWTAANPVLAAGEIGFETDTNQFKIGDGSSQWGTLSYFKNLEDLGGLDDFTLISREGVANGVATLNENGHIPISQLGSLITNAPGVLDTLGEIAQFVEGVDSAVSAHSNTSLNVHGIADTAALATYAQLNTHSIDTTNVHGIEDTDALATKTYADNAVTVHNGTTENIHGIANTADLATKTYADNAVEAHNDLTQNVHGIADTGVLVTQTDLTNAISGAEVDQSLLAGTGIDWNSVDNRFDIDNTIATKTYADDAVETHNDLTENIHGIADTSALATKTYADNAVSTAVGALTKSSVGLANVDNTSDADKPVSTATQTALDLKAPLADPTFTGTVSGVTKTHVGLGDVDNTSDANKPVSTATQAALDLKANLNAPTFTGTVTSTNDVVVNGNLTVNGTTFNASATSITIEDNMVQLAHQNAANTVDLGVVVAYNDGAAKHAGIVRDVSDAKWKLFKDVSTEPSTTVAFGEGSLDALAVGALEATTVTASSGIVFSDGTQVKVGVPSITTFATAISSSGTLAAGEQDKFVPLTGAVTITLPATG
jgi:hypothetical protein